MKRSLLSLMLICFACFGVAKADELTVHNGTTTNSYVPFYGYYADEDQQNQMIYPATELSDMNGMEITAMIFDYSSLGSSGSGVGTWTVKIGETRETTLSGLDNSTTLTEVFTGNLDALFNTSAKTLNIEFDNGYTYRGGNLLVEFSHTAGTWKSCSFYGENVTGASYCYDAQRDFLPSTTFSYERPSSCAKPTNLAVNYEGGTTATVTWEGDARSYNIDVNGTVTNGVTSPYTLSNLEYATDYTVMVQADCGDEQSGWVSQSFRTDCGVTPLPFFCGFEDESEYGCLGLSNTASNTGLAGSDYARTGNYAFVFSYNTNPPQYLFFPEFEGTAAINMSFFYKIYSSNYPETFQVGYSTTTQTISAFTWLDEVTANNTSEWLEYEETLPNGTKYVAIRYNSYDMYYLFLDDFNFEAATGCLKPSGLEATNVGTTSAVLNWTGDNDSYVLQYRTGAHDNMNLWEQVGEDVVATASMTKYTFDLSSYSGTGNIAIRHYNVSDMFYLNLDDIVVTNAADQEVINQGFEEGSIPSDWSNIDYDGDGQVWGIRSSGTIIGSYSATSASWNNSALTPDNWLIIPNVELGGELTLYAAGQDASFPQENFGVFVTTASLETVFGTTPAGEWSADIPSTETSYELTGLTANTEYDWRVKGICDGTETGWASSSFTTIAEGYKTFVTEGNWDVDANWFPAGVPAITDEVSIEAAVTIPAGVVATAKRVDLNGGSILIKDGGQLKQGAATLRVTMEKEITGYGTGDGNYYFIASPFSGRTLYQASGTWSRVDNLFNGEYDLYAFDAAAADGLEWINYKSEPTHISFVSDNGNEGLMYGEGYLYANKAGTTLNFVGTTGKSVDYSETIDYTFDSESTDDWNGWKLVGNYFSCNAYISYVDERGNALDADFYTLNLDNTYSLMASNQPLPPCTGALINYSATGKVQYATEAPTSKASMLNMAVSEGRGTIDQIRVRFGQGHNLQHMSFRNSSKLYMPVDNNDYAVVYADNQGEMPVNFKAEKNGSYTISFSNENVEFGYLHLIDNMTGADIDLLETPSYSFDAKVTDYASRFKLVFAAGSNNNDSFAFYNNGNIVINNEGSAILNIVDVLGRTISSQTINGSENVSFNANAGVYTLQLIQGEKVKTQKIVVE